MQNREQADRLDRFRREGETVDRLRFGVQHGETGGRRERVAHEQAGEDGSCAGERECARRPQRECDGEGREEDGRGGEAEPGAGALVEMVGQERAVDPGADCAGEDDDVAPELERAHLTITVPSMSWLCSVQTYS
jgi:hypothetical protein